MSEAKKVVSRFIADIKEFIWAGIVFAIYYLISHYMNNAFCPLLAMTGIPCAGCGLTRAAVFLAKGQVMRAAYINPSIFPVLIFLLYCGYFRYIKGSAIKGLKPALAGLVLCMLIIYVYRMYLYFPDRAPYVYQYSNAAARRIPGYSDKMREVLRNIRAWRAGI